MADHISPLQLTDSQFDSLLEKIDFAFQNSFGALFYRQPSGPLMIDIFDPREAGFSVEEWDLYGPLIPYMDELLIFAFEGGPTRVVESWADEHESGFGEVAVARVELMRDRLPSVRKQWTSRRSAVAVNVLGDVRTQIMLNPETAEWQALLRIDSYVPGRSPRRVAVDSSREWLTALVTRNDISRMISILEYARELMPVFDPTGDVEDEEAR